MIELITVCVVLGLLVAGWFAVCIDAQGIKEGIKMAVRAGVRSIEHGTSTRRRSS